MADASSERERLTCRLFVTGAGFSKPAGLPLASELLPLVLDVARDHFRVDGCSHIENAIERYEAYVADVDPGQPFDLERFGEWLDWEHTLRLAGPDTFSDHGNQAGLQLRWAIGKVLHEATPRTLPEVYLDFASQLNDTDCVLTLNYDCLLERALEAVGLLYRRFPHRYSEVYDGGADIDEEHPRELKLGKLHGSIDWTYAKEATRSERFSVHPLVEGPRHSDDPLLNIAVIDQEHLSDYYSFSRNWAAHPPVLMPPSRAKPLASSELIPLWDGVGLYAYAYGGFTVIGCSLPPGDPYVLQLVHHIATDYASGRSSPRRLVAQRRIKVVDQWSDSEGERDLMNRYRFMDPMHTDFILNGFTTGNLPMIFAPPDLIVEP